MTLPALGESVTEGTVSRWLKQVGDTVEADEPLLEVSTDKVDTEIPSPVAGTLLEIRVAEDETVEVGAVLVVIGDASQAGSAPEADAPANETARSTPPTRPRSRPPPATRAVRRRSPPSLRPRHPRRSPSPGEARSRQARGRASPSRAKAESGDGTAAT